MSSSRTWRISSELLGRIWMRPVRGTGWYCWGFPLPERRRQLGGLVSRLGRVGVPQGMALIPFSC